MTPATIPKLVCWTLILVVSLAVCLYSILDKWNKFETSPVIVSFAETTTPIWQIPFPAITVCSNTRSRATVFNYTRVRETWTRNHTVEEQDKEMFEAVSLMCRSRQPPGELLANQSVVDIIRKVAAPLSDMVSYVRWRDVELKAEALFHPLLTKHGICYSFNMLNAQELYTNVTEQDDYFLQETGPEVTKWSLDEGYTKQAGQDPFPRRALGTRDANGLTIIMDALTEDLDHVCHGPYQGFKVFVHNPAEVPVRTSKFVRVPLNQEVDAAVTPTLMTTSEELRDYTPERRQCHYPSGRQLRYYKVYTQRNCVQECVTNYTRYMCDCVGFHMPRDANTSICGPKSADCMNYAAGELPKKEIAALLQEFPDSTKNDASKTPINDHFQYRDCDCLPTCTELQYDVKIAHNDFPWRQVLHGFGELSGKRPGLNKARINIFFDDAQIFTSRRSELYGRTDFLASCGGLLGLFMGFSILSLVEIIYFFTIRVCCNLSKRNHKHDGLAPLAESDDTELEETKLHIP